MNQGSSEISDRVTALVFKDNYAARTFQIPLNWISKFGIFLGILCGLTAISAFLAVKYYRVAARTDPSRVQDLEQELTDLRTSLKALESKPADSASIITSTPHTGATPSSAVGPTPKVSPSGLTLTMQKSDSFVNFSSFPPATSTTIPDPTTLPFLVKVPKAKWRGRTLRVQFALQYMKEDQGNQQGRILILARGPENLLAYPDGIFNRVGTEILIAPEKGEYFSVSRFREVKANFGPVLSQHALTEVEIFIFSMEGQILAYQKIQPSLTKKQATPEPIVLPETEKQSGNTPANPTDPTGSSSNADAPNP